MAKHKTPDAVRFAIMVGSNLKYLRLRKVPFSPMKIVAHHIGVKHQQVAKYENGKNIPCAYRLVQLADYYKVSTNDLVNPDFIIEQTTNNDISDSFIEQPKGLTPQDAGYLKPQKDIGSLEEIQAELKEEVQKQMNK